MQRYSSLAKRTGIRGIAQDVIAIGRIFPGIPRGFPVGLLLAVVSTVPRLQKDEEEEEEEDFSKAR